MWQRLIWNWIHYCDAEKQRGFSNQLDLSQWVVSARENKHTTTTLYTFLLVDLIVFDNKEDWWWTNEFLYCWTAVPMSKKIWRTKRDKMNGFHNKYFKVISVQNRNCYRYLSVKYRYCYRYRTNPSRYHIGTYRYLIGNRFNYRYRNRKPYR